MRHLLLALALLPAFAGQAPGNEARTAIGDVPRTYTHFMNAQEAALCRANAATGGVSAYFFNPAVLSEVSGISGQASMRFNVKSRDYLPQQESNYLDVDSDDSVLFSQAVAAKGAENITFGFGYSTPAYRNLRLTGQLEDPLAGAIRYAGDYTGSLRHFELLGAVRIGSDGQAGVGLAAGIASFDEYAREVAGPEQNHSRAQLDGMAASAAIGFIFDATDKLTIGAGYRFGTSFDVDGEWKPPQDTDIDPDPAKKGTVKTEPVAVGGIRFSPTENYSIYLGYTNEGWDSADATFAAYYPTAPCDQCEAEDAAERDEFDKALGTFALGAEGTILDGRLTLRAGYSLPQTSGFSNDDEPEYRELVPQYAAGLGGTWHFEAYSIDAALVREEFADGDETGQVVNTGIYLSVGYDFE
ncbi:MAG: hypothetical protein JXB46_03645 [Candidatus Eisenbacteria bacterium]|nr:hypothetical protein [Candidatus Eisenbacteria bacterium]